MTGTPFLGFDVVRRGGVLFIALESASEIAIRLHAVIETRGVLTGCAPSAWIESCPSLLRANAVEELGKIIAQVASKLERDFGLPLVLIIIDTVVLAAKYAKEGAENDTPTNAALMDAMEQIARKARCFVFGVDHFGKDVSTGTRGASAKEDNAHVVIALLGERAITGEMTNARLVLRKRRSGGPSGLEFPFTPRVVDMGLDERGKPITTLVLVWGTAATPKPLAKDKDSWGQSKSIKLLRRTLMNLLADQGVDLKPWADGPMVRALKLDLVREEFCKAWYVEGDDAKAKRQAKIAAFRRAVTDAVDKGVLVSREIDGQDFVWVAERRNEATNGREGETTASVPFMITLAMKEQLRARGYGDDAIRNMTPTRTQEILAGAMPNAPDA
jgi:hypothetical protein